MKYYHKLFVAMVMALSLWIGLCGQMSISQAAQTDPVLTKIKKDGKLVVGTSADYAPYEFHTTVNGQDKIVGFDIRIAKEIADQLGVKLVVQDMSFDALLGGVKTGKLDLVLAGMSETPERAREVNFSKVYYTDPSVILTKKGQANPINGVQDLPKVTLGAQLTTVQEDAAKAVDPKKVVSLKKMPDLLTQLNQGKVDGLVVSKTIADTYIAQNDAYQIAPVTLPAASASPASIVVPKNAPILLDKVNTILEENVMGKPLAKWRKTAIRQSLAKESFIKKYGPLFWKGTVYTVGLAIIGVFGGIILGTLLALMKLASFRPAKWLAISYIEAVRGVPLLIQVFMVYFGTQLLGLNLSSFAAGAIALFLNSAAYVAEIIRAGIQSVDVGQTEAARSLGFSKFETMRYIILPQAIKNILPALGNEFVTVIKEGSVVSVIGVGELTFQTTVVQGASFKPFVPLVITAAIYFILTFGISRLMGYFEKKLHVTD
ncbi:ABC transporter substrate-binding protein/permease [Weissella halotolerans]|nr:ABC transporter substrate-binding protein/permease [Weissella halotolerans]